MPLTSTKKKNAVKITGVLFGESASGKTTLVRTCVPKSDYSSVLLVDADNGTLALRGLDIPVWSIETEHDIDALLGYLKSPEAAHVRWIWVDSLTAAATQHLNAGKAKESNPMRAYGNTQDWVLTLIGELNKLPQNVIYVCELDKVTDEQGRIMFGPAMPGSKLSSRLPYYVDFVFALQVVTNEEGETVRRMQCNPCGRWTAKDRSGMLPQFIENDKINFGQMANAILQAN